MMLILLSSLLAILALLALSLRFPVVASLSKALCRWLSYPLTFLSVAALKTAAWCLGVYNRCLTWPVSPQGMQPAEEANPALVLLFRVFIFLCSALIYLGDLQLAMYRSAFFYNLLSPVLRVIPPEVFAAGAGAMWICMATLYGIVLCEAAEMMPKGVHLFSSTSIWTRIILGVFSFICFLASSVLIALFYAYGQQEILHLSPSPELALLITQGFGLLITIVSLIAAWALVIGGLGIVCLIAGALSCAFVIISTALFLAGKVLEDFGSIVPSHDLEPAVKRPVSQSKARDIGDEPLSSAGVAHPDPVSVHEEKEVIAMEDAKQTLSIMGHNLFGTLTVPVLVQGLDDVGASSRLVALGLVDPDSPYQRTPVASRKRRVRIITPSATKMQNALTKDAIGESSIEALTQSMHDSLVGVYAEKHIHTGPILVAVSLSTIPLIASAIRSLKHCLPRHTIIVVTEQPVFENRNAAAKGWEALRTLRQDGIVDATFLLDRTGELAVRMGAEAMERACAQTLMGVCVAPIHHAQNPPLAAVANCLGEYEPLIGMDCHVRKVNSGKPRALWPLVKRFVPAAGEKGRGDYKDALDKAIEGTRAVTQDRDKAKPCFVAYSIPFRPTDSNFKLFAREIRAFCANILQREQGMTIHPIVISANGTYIPGEDMGYRVQVTCLYPLSPKADLVAMPVSTPLEKTDGHRSTVTADDLQ